MMCDMPSASTDTATRTMVWLPHDPQNTRSISLVVLSLCEYKKEREGRQQSTTRRNTGTRNVLVARLALEDERAQATDGAAVQRQQQQAHLHQHILPNTSTLESRQCYNGAYLHSEIGGDAGRTAASGRRIKLGCMLHAHLFQMSANEQRERRRRGKETNRGKVFDGDPALLFIHVTCTHPR
jgi:hypothetical protein